MRCTAPPAAGSTPAARASTSLARSPRATSPRWRCCRPAARRAPSSRRCSRRSGCRPCRCRSPAWCAATSPSPSRTGPRPSSTRPGPELSAGRGRGGRAHRRRAGGPGELGGRRRQPAARARRRLLRPARAALRTSTPRCASTPAGRRSRPRSTPARTWSSRTPRSWPSSSAAAARLADVLDAADEVRKRGVGTVLVSLGGDGALLVGADQALHGWAPPCGSQHRGGGRRDARRVPRRGRPRPERARHGAVLRDGGRRAARERHAAAGRPRPGRGRGHRGPGSGPSCA